MIVLIYQYLSFIIYSLYHYLIFMMYLILFLTSAYKINLRFVHINVYYVRIIYHNLVSIGLLLLSEYVSLFISMIFLFRLTEISLQSFYFLMIILLLFIVSIYHKEVTHMLFHITTKHLNK